MADNTQTIMGPPTLPWWRIRMVWLVIGGPALVVVAGFITLALAIHGGDQPVPNPGSASQAFRR
ncbi:MAG: hypothetical protein Q7V20_08035 [Aquabacterium sp.]|uniref:hypothetical protein n=1 Tax=Aquabacterium sp. TaxID=1872578 RepID=UPI002715DAB3|nr:hypothetical protein [Aquabacterium sp.]MDO9003383.1 hypothetical protein [Aquabacterium sp.]